ncbi:MAG: hypothetical protein V4719_22940 [Planctomycetota bacterium]
MSVKTIVLGDDETVVKFKIGGVEFECFPVDEIEVINEQALPENGEPVTGVEFCRICQERLKNRYQVTASLNTAGEWYRALHNESKEQEAFFGESPASSGPTDSLPQAGETTGADANSATTNSDSSSLPKAPSKRKNSRKPS